MWEYIKLTKTTPFTKCQLINEGCRFFCLFLAQTVITKSSKEQLSLRENSEIFMAWLAKGYHQVQAPSRF
ncbi:hypothetical protein CCP4SC76_7140002 [Gammaproteobacteria bacterium]